MRWNMTKVETALGLAGAALVALAVFGPYLAQPAQYHGFADQRVLWGLPFAMDVLSNLGFAIAGIAGGWTLYRVPARTLSNMQRAMAALLFAGLLLTAAASAWYHWQPDDAGLAIDRGGMALAFAGLLGLAAASRVSERAGAALGLAVLLLAPISIYVWVATGNILPWAVLQFGAMALIVWLALLRSRYPAPQVRWVLVVVTYAAAKLLEVGDHEVYALTGQLVSGHTLKHLLAALAIVPVIAALWTMGDPRQRAARSPGTKGIATRRAGSP
jgi:hypothetical protein